MKIAFQLVDSGLKRWHGKVVRAAADHLTSLTEGFPHEIPETLAAEFSVAENGKTTICRSNLNRQTIVTIVFNATTWETVDSSVGDATEQLAAAVLHLIPQERVANLRQLFANGGVSYNRVVQETSRSIPCDPRTHLVINFHSPKFEFSELQHRFDELDMILQRERSGEVDGSGTGIMGHQFDVSLQDREAGLRSLFAFLNRHNLSKYVRIADSDTDQELSIPRSGD